MIFFVRSVQHQCYAVCSNVQSVLLIDHNFYLFLFVNLSNGEMQLLDFGSSSDGSIYESDNENVDSDYVFEELEESGKKDDGENDDDLDDDELFEKEFRLHKRNYYISKMHYPEMTKYVPLETWWILFTG